MYLDAFTIAALVDEFMDSIVGGRIQDILDVDETAIGLEIYANRRRQYLYLSADNQQPRVHIVPDKLRRGLPRASHLRMQLQRAIEGGVVVHASQPELERVLAIHIESDDAYHRDEAALHDLLLVSG